jgi:hypothetical protein
MSTRTVETISRELEAARTKLAELKADHDKHGKRAEELRAQGVALIAEGKRSESRRNREARLDAEDEQAACAILATRGEQQIKALEAEHAEAVRADLQTRLSAADGLVEEVGRSLSAALDGLARAALRHREARSDRDTIARSLGYTTSGWDQTEWSLLGGLLLRGAIHSGNLTLDRSSLLRFVQPDAARQRKESSDEAMQQEFERTRADYLRDELAHVRKRIKAMGTSKAKAEVARRASLVAQAQMIERQIRDLENPEPEPAEVLEEVSA